MDGRNKINDSNAESFFLYLLFLIFRKDGNNEIKNRKGDSYDSGKVV
jgi:hypothetical protein